MAGINVTDKPGKWRSEGVVSKVGSGATENAIVASVLLVGRKWRSLALAGPGWMGHVQEAVQGLLSQVNYNYPVDVECK